ncbi:jhamt [Trichonephila clavata]|uniref:Jhamt n=1 Tax=Trichonephila clavata TaxID=2740835 RepID=A0A8X6GK14_TRICU|nr:jhamt [Trichonephila clavata]
MLRILSPFTKPDDDPRSFDEEKGVQFFSDECFKDFFLEHLKIYHKLSPESTDTFEAEVLELYEKTFGRKEGKLFYVSVQLDLFGVKPVEISDSKSKETTVV